MTSTTVPTMTTCPPCAPTSRTGQDWSDAESRSCFSGRANRSHNRQTDHDRPLAMHPARKAGAMVQTAIQATREHLAETTHRLTEPDNRQAPVSKKSEARGFPNPNDKNPCPNAIALHPSLQSAKGFTVRGPVRRAHSPPIPPGALFPCRAIATEKAHLRSGEQHGPAEEHAVGHAE